MQARKQDQQAAKDLRRKVAGTTIKTDSNRPIDRLLNYQTNNQLVHKSPGAIEPIDTEWSATQRKKLTAASIHMGKQAPIYSTTQKTAFHSMRGVAFSVDQMKRTVDNNRRTNFISL